MPKGYVTWIKFTCHIELNYAFAMPKNLAHHILILIPSCFYNLENIISVKLINNEHTLSMRAKTRSNI